MVTQLKRFLADTQDVDIVVCPPCTALSEVSEVLMDSDIELGAQDLYWEESGAFTGEVSGSMLKDAGAVYVIIGHSERRQYFHETDETVNKKLKAALRDGLTPIVCIGELLKEREAEETFKVLETQIQGALAGLGREDMEAVLIAYEPVWAIGTGKVATPLEAQEAHAFIRKEIAKMFGSELASSIRIQYGGSVKPDNIAGLMQQPDIDGALVGGASLDAKGFADIVKNAKLVRV